MDRDSLKKSAGPLTVALTAGLVASFSPQAAHAYAKADTAAAQMKLLRDGVASGTVVPVKTDKSSGVYEICYENSEGK